jgi:hypothetical protein
MVLGEKEKAALVGARAQFGFGIRLWLVCTHNNVRFCVI